MTGRIFKYAVLLFVAAACAPALDNVYVENEEEICLSVSPEGASATKSSLDVSEYDISDSDSFNGDRTIKNVVFAAYRTSDSSLQNVVYVTSDNAKISLKTSETYSIYAIVNMGDVCSSLPSSDEQMGEWRISVDSFSSMQKGALPMCGCKKGVSLSGGTVMIPVQMMVHRLVLNIVPTSGFELRDVRIRQAALDMTPFAQGSTPAVVGDGDEASIDNIHDLSQGLTSDFYIFENMRGDLLPSNTDSWLKVPSSLSDADAAMATYVEITMAYDSLDGVAGDVVYRFCLGEDTTCNFDVQRANTRFLTFCPSADNLYAGSWKVDSEEVVDSRVLLFCSGCQSIRLTQGSNEKVTVKIHYNTSNPNSYSASSRPAGTGLVGSYRGVKWDFTPSYADQLVRLLSLGITCRQQDDECTYLLDAKYSTTAGIVTMDIATPDGRVTDRATITVVGQISWDNSSEFENNDASIANAYTCWFTQGMKKTMKLSGFTSTSGVTANVVSVSANGNSWTDISASQTCDFLDIVSVSYTSKTADVVLGGKKNGYAKIRISSPSTMQEETFIVAVSDVDLRCDGNYSAENWSPKMTGEAVKKAIHCYLPGFDAYFGDAANQNPPYNVSIPTTPCSYYAGIIPFSAFDSNSSGTGYWDKYVKPVVTVRYPKTVFKKCYELKVPGDASYTAEKDDYGYSCLRARFVDVPLESELSSSSPFVCIDIAKSGAPGTVVATRPVYAMPFFVPSLPPGHVGVLHDWSLFEEGKLADSYKNRRAWKSYISTFVNTCKDAYLRSGATLTSEVKSDLSDANECIEFEFDGYNLVSATITDSGTHALGRLQLFATVKNTVSGRALSIYAGYVDVFLHVAVGAEIVCSETAYSLPFTDDYDFPSGMACYGYGIRMAYMRSMTGKCSFAAGLPASNDASAKCIVDGGQNDDTALINDGSSSGYFFYRDPRLRNSSSTLTLTTLQTLRYYRYMHDGYFPLEIWNKLWGSISKSSANPRDDISYVLWSAPFNKLADGSGTWYEARWPTAKQLVWAGPEANVKVYSYDHNTGLTTEQTNGVLYYIPSSNVAFVCSTKGSELDGKGYLVIHNLYQCCPSTRGWLANY